MSRNNETIYMCILLVQVQNKYMLCSQLTTLVLSFFLPIGTLQNGVRRNLVMRRVADAVRRQRCSTSWRTSYPCLTVLAPIWTKPPSWDWPLVSSEHVKYLIQEQVWTGKCFISINLCYISLHVTWLWHLFLIILMCLSTLGFQNKSLYSCLFICDCV